ncbi:DNA mismatch repair protein MutS [Euryarchaeota archaeon]|nr:DNA mismatch repair protein MutS [Euryarchaeota archaeon]
MMRQYHAIKRENPDSILLFRMGDFYETFGDDAVIVAKDLDITLTARDKNSDNPIPLAGVPYHALDGYLGKLIKKGHRVAICEQLEDPKSSKGIVRRGVTRIVSPGTVVEGTMLSNSNNFLASINETDEGLGLAIMDISTGEFATAQFGDRESLESEMMRYSPSEVIVPEGNEHIENWMMALGVNTTPQKADSWMYPVAKKTLEKRFGSVEELKTYPMAIAAAGSILSYATETQFSELPHLRPPSLMIKAKTMTLDAVTLRNLEIVRTIGDSSKDTLFAVVNKTSTAGGSRRLKDWFLRPLHDLKRINERHDAVQELFENTLSRREIRDILKGFQDVERLLSRLGHGSISPRDLDSLRFSLNTVKELKQFLTEEPLKSKLMKKLVKSIDVHKQVADKLAEAIVEEPPLVLRDGGIFKKGYSKELDDLRSKATSGREWVIALEAEEKKKTGIPKLKIGYNRVFGYYLEIPKAFAKKVPESYHRKQTVAAGDRYITPELKEKETSILRADERSQALEAELFKELREWVMEFLGSLQATTMAISRIDAVCSLAEVSQSNNYVRPEMSDDGALSISDGRHPVIEVLREGKYIPNSLQLDNKQRQLMILTGPNMGGKSTYMRQTALICIMAQAGCFVPASSARLGMVDRVFTRVGAHDDLVHGHSTFMVEMLELANILRNATTDSLVLLDEIGRGTSTFDGLALAWAVSEQLHAEKGVKTLFATHYHQLTDVAKILDRSVNCHMQAKEDGHELTLLHRVAEGPTDASFGIHVAKMAGVPEEVLARARKVLENLEQGTTIEVSKTGPVQSVFSPNFSARSEIKENPVINEIKKMDLMNLTPLQALEKLHDIQQKLL